MDVLLLFRDLPPAREPQAGMAEAIAERVARRTGVPVEVWSVATSDLWRGFRTPMLVDALADGITLFPEGAPPLRVPFTPDDAVRCTGALMQRVEEGSAECAAHRRAGDLPASARRMRDDVVRLCTALLLLHGVTRPRRADAVRRCAALPAVAPLLPRYAPTLRWAARSFGPTGSDEARALRQPPGGLPAAARLIDDLRLAIRRRVEGHEGALSLRFGVGGGARTSAVPPHLHRLLP